MLVIILALAFIGNVRTQSGKRNVIIIMADDLGYHDVGYRGSNEIPTYNIDALAYNGIILDKYLKIILEHLAFSSISISPVLEHLHFALRLGRRS
jgi:hypothetical protein